MALLGYTGNDTIVPGMPFPFAQGFPSVRLRGSGIGAEGLLGPPNGKMVSLVQITVISAGDPPPPHILAAPCWGVAKMAASVPEAFGIL